MLMMEGISKKLTPILLEQTGVTLSLQINTDMRPSEDQDSNLWQVHYNEIKKDFRRKFETDFRGKIEKNNPSDNLDLFYTELEASYPSRADKESFVAQTDLDNWLTTDERNCFIKALTGSPGSGKSTLCLKWALKTIESNTIFRVFYVDFENLFAKGKPFPDFIKSLKNKAKKEFKNKNYDITEESHLLLIIDGLDKTTVTPSSTHRFVDDLCEFTTIQNSNHKFLNVLITGRSGSIQSTLERCGNFKNEEVIQLNPYSEEQRDSFWNTMIAHQTNNEDKKKLGNALKSIQKDTGLNELTLQPLLNSLLASYVRDTKSKDLSDQVDRIFLYNYLSKESHKRTLNSGNQEFVRDYIKTDTQDILLPMMEKLALCCWENNWKPLEEEPFQECIKATTGFDKDNLQEAITLLSDSLYWGFKGHPKTWQFKHQTFGEFLIAKHALRLIRASENSLTWFTSEWIKSFSKSCLDDVIVGFFYELVTKETKEDREKWYSLISNVSVENLTKDLASLFPMSDKKDPASIDSQKDVEPRTNGNSNIGLQDKHLFLESKSINHLSELISFFRTNSYNPTLALLACLDTLAWISEKPSLTYNESLHQWIALSQTQRSIQSPETDLGFLKYLRRLKINETPSLNFINLSYAHLDYSDMEKAKLNQANLSHARLEKAEMKRAELTGAFLHEAILSWANMESTVLINACLTNTKLNGANLQNAQLAGANLTGAILQGANLKNITFDKYTRLENVYGLDRAINVPHEFMNLYRECNSLD